jgi:hypothetical protein
MRDWLGVPPNSPREERLDHSEFMSAQVRRGSLLGLLLLLPLLLALAMYGTPGGSSGASPALPAGAAGRSQACMNEAQRDGHDLVTAGQMCAR